jgi:hypothetical protein
MHGRNARGTGLALYIQGEIGHIDTDEDIRTGRQQLGGQASSQCVQTGVMLEDLEQPHDRQFVDACQRAAAGGKHPRPSHAQDIDRRVTGAEGGDQVTAKLVT